MESGRSERVHLKLHTARAWPARSSHREEGAMVGALGVGEIEPLRTCGLAHVHHSKQ
jgi:hypothetical protein